MDNNFTYCWKPETEKIYAGKDASKVASEIASIGENPTNAQIVAKARDTSTELHSMFEWDDTVAADKYRETQAHRIVCNLMIVKVGLNEDKPKEDMKPFRLYHHIDSNPGYMPIQRIMNDTVMHQQLLDQAMADLRAFKQKYAMLEELQPIFALIA